MLLKLLEARNTFVWECVALKDNYKDAADENAWAAYKKEKKAIEIEYYNTISNLILSARTTKPEKV